MGARSNDIAFKVSLRMVKERDNSDVFFKVDGERFKENKTLKFHIDCSYKLTLEFRPGIQLSALSFGGANLTPEVKKHEESMSCYECKWSTAGMTNNKKKDRTEIHLCINIDRVGQLDVPFQCKFYPLSDKSHVTWGTPVKSIDLDCNVKEGRSFIDVKQVTFR